MPRRYIGINARIRPAAAPVHKPPIHLILICTSTATLHTHHHSIGFCLFSHLRVTHPASLSSFFTTYEATLPLFATSHFSSTRCLVCSSTASHAQRSSTKQIYARNTQLTHWCSPAVNRSSCVSMPLGPLSLPHLTTGHCTRRAHLCRSVSRSGFLKFVPKNNPIPNR